MKRSFFFTVILFTAMHGFVQAQHYANPYYLPVFHHSHHHESSGVDFDEVRERIQTMSSPEWEYSFNDKVYKWVEFFAANNRNYTKQIVARHHLYFPIFEKALQRHGLPDQLKYLAIVESALRPTAVSPAGAGGLWQFMPATGRMFGLRVDSYVDERMDPEKSTEAACQYLKYLYRMFNSWELALAAYNVGPGYVSRAIYRSGGKRTFWEIYNYLPGETRSYVPQFIAVAYTMNHIHEHKLYPDYLEYRIGCDTIKVNGYMDLELLGKKLNVCKQELLDLNPSLKAGILPDYVTNYTVYIPSDVKGYYCANRGWILDSCAIKVEKTPTTSSDPTKYYHTVRSGESLGVIASKWGVSVYQIKTWNGLKSDMIYPNQKLVIYKNGAPKTYSTASATTTNTTVQTTKTVTNTTTTVKARTYVVQQGDTLWSISQKYPGVTVDAIKQKNGLADNNIKPGQSLVIP